MNTFTYRFDVLVIYLIKFNASSFLFRLVLCFLYYGSSEKKANNNASKTYPFSINAPVTAQGGIQLDALIVDVLPGRRFCLTELQAFASLGLDQK